MLTGKYKKLTIEQYFPSNHNNFLHCDGKYPKSFQLYLARAGQLRRSVLDQNCKNGRNIQTLTFLLFFSILGWYPTLRNEPKLRYNRWIRLMNCFICGLPPEDTKSLWHLMTILYWLSCKIPHLIIEAEINSKFKHFWHCRCFYVTLNSVPVRSMQKARENSKIFPFPFLFSSIKFYDWGQW